MEERARKYQKRMVTFVDARLDLGERTVKVSFQTIIFICKKNRKKERKKAGEKKDKREERNKEWRKGVALSH